MPYRLIEVHDISKKFSRSLTQSQLLALGEIFRSTSTAPTEEKPLKNSEFWAIKNISFKVKKGEILGIIGKNGAGKTTLLRLIAGLFQPTSGYVIREGKVSSIFAGTSGMDPMLTGRQNIVMRSAILGVTPENARDKMREIIEFAELEDFIDAPLGTYSTGMKARLGFSVNVAFHADILILDEGLAVGDRKFKEKCIRKLRQIKDDSIILTVSHSPFILKELCTRILVLENGQVIQDTHDVREAVGSYIDSLKTNYADEINLNWNHELTSTDIWFEQLRLLQSDNSISLSIAWKSHIQTQGSVSVTFRDEFHEVNRLSQPVEFGQDQTGSCLFEIEEELIKMRPTIVVRCMIDDREYLLSKSIAKNLD